MGNISYTAHVSNKKSAITSKTKLAAVAKHNLRKYKSSDYSKDNIVIVYGTSNLIDDVKTVYHKEFDEALSSFRLFAPAIEEYANHVEADKTIEAGNSFRGILYEIGKLLETFKKLIKEGLCWFPRLMRWKTSKGEVAPVFIEKSNGYSYSVYGYMNVDTKEYYSKELMQREIKAGNRTGTVEQMDANVEAMARDLQEILRIGAEQKRLWEVYKGR